MIYLIGGPPRSGKTILAVNVSSKLGTRYISLDAIRQKLEQDDPELGVRNGNDAELNAGRMWKSIKALIKKEENQGGDCVIEGADLEPLLAHELLADSNIRLLFVGYSSTSVTDKIAEIRAHAEEREWTVTMSDEDLRRLIDDEISRSQRFQRQCQERGIRYIDTGSRFTEAIAAAESYLIEGEP